VNFVTIFWPCPNLGNRLGCLVSQFGLIRTVKQQISPKKKMTSVSELKKKLHGAWRSMGEQDFISRPWVITLLVIMAAVFILIMAPTVIQKLPDNWNDLATNREAVRNRLAVAADFIPGMRNRLEGSLSQMQQMKSNVSNPSIGAIIFLLVTLCLTLISFFRPDFFPRNITPIEWSLNNQRS